MYQIATCTYGKSARLESCSRDPIGFEGSEWNLHEFGGSSPVASSDPTALSMICIEVGKTCFESVRDFHARCIRNANGDESRIEGCNKAAAIQQLTCFFVVGYCFAQWGTMPCPEDDTPPPEPVEQVPIRKPLNRNPCPPGCMLAHKYAGNLLPKPIGCVGKPLAGNRWPTQAACSVTCINCNNKGKDRESRCADCYRACGGNRPTRAEQNAILQCQKNCTLALSINP